MIISGSLQVESSVSFVERKLNKLHKLLGDLIHVKPIENPAIAKVLAKMVIARLHKPAYYNSIFKGASSNPFRHTQLAFKVGVLARKFINLEVTLLAQITAAYQAMLKIQRVPMTKLPGDFDLHWQIIKGMLTGKDNLIDRMQISKIRDIYYGFSQKYIWKTCKCDDFPEIDLGNPAQERINVQNFSRAMLNAITHFKIKDFDDFTVEDFDRVAPYITRYKHKMFRHIYYQESRILKNFQCLTNVDLKYQESLGSLPFPEKVRDLSCSTSLVYSREATALEKFTNIKDLKLKSNLNHLLLGLPNPEKLIRLSCTDCPDDFLKRLENIEILELSSPKACDLSLLPHPEKLKVINFNICSITEDLFAKFVNLESFKVPFQDIGEIMKIASTSSTIKTLILESYLEDVIRECCCFPSVEIIHLKGAVKFCYTYPINSDLMIKKFPNLKFIRTKEPEKIEDGSRKRLEAAHIHLLKK